MFGRFRTPRSSFWIVAVGLISSWGLAGWVVLPWIVERAYRQESFGFINAVISGRREHPVDFYLEQVSSLAWAGLAAGLVLAGVAYLAVGFRGALEPLTRILRAPFAADAPRFTAGAVLLWAAAWGLACGAAEALIITVREDALGITSWLTSSEIVWMAPIVAALIFLALAVFLLSLSLVWPSLRNARVVGCLFPSLAVFVAVRVAGGGIHPAAAFLLAAGLGFRLARFADQAADRVAVRLPAAAAALLAIVIGAGLALEARSRLRAGPNYADASMGASSPNVLLIVMDTVRARSTSVHGYERATTPGLERLGEDGVVFDSAFSSSSWTLPSHTSLFTGLPGPETGVGWHQPLGPGPLTLAEYLVDQGYAAAGFAANLYYVDDHFGLDRGFPEWFDYPVSWRMALQNEWLATGAVERLRALAGSDDEFVRKSTEDIRRDFIAWVDEIGPKPFFGFLNLFEAHTPFGPWNEQRAFADPDAPRKFGLDTGRVFGEAELSGLTDSYDSAIRYIDDQLTMMFEELDRRGILDETVVIVTSDHGEAFGERDPRLVNHGNDLYMETIHVPLVIRYPPAVAAGQRVDAPVSIADLPATVAELTGATGPLPFGDTSLSQFWRDDGSAPETRAVVSSLTAEGRDAPHQPVTYGPMVSIVRGSFQYIRTGTEREELFDLSRDPYGLEDLSGDPKMSRLLARMRHLADPEGHD